MQLQANTGQFRLEKFKMLAKLWFNFSLFEKVVWDIYVNERKEKKCKNKAIMTK